MVDVGLLKGGYVTLALKIDILIKKMLIIAINITAKAATCYIELELKKFKIIWSWLSGIL